MKKLFSRILLSSLLISSFGSSVLYAAQNRFNKLLINAAYDGDEKNVKMLVLLYEADINAQNKSGDTPLYWASAEGHGEIVQFLLASGAGVDIQNREGFTPLISAATNGYEEIVTLLLENNAYINAQDNKGETALMCAAFWDRESIVRLLLEKGADADLTNTDGKTAYDVSSPEIKELIEQHKKAQEENK